MEAARAYAMGRNSVWMEMGPKCPLTDAELRNHWLDGRRHAQAELRLDADAEWDEE